MKSTAHIKGHPIHPILVSFPIAFFTGTFISDLIYWLNGNSSFFIIASYLNIAGVAFALMAAIPGIIDFLYTVPPNSSGKKRALKHGITNVSVVIIFIISYFLRIEEDINYIFLIILEFLGMVGLLIAGWMGGTLVYRNQIGVDPRTANAGKWRELYLENKNGRIELDELPQLKADQMILIHSDDKRIVLAKSENKLVAFDDHCSHRGGSLAAGMLICGTVQCPWHGSQFNVNTGVVKAGPAKEKIRSYSVNEAGSKVFIDLNK